MQNLLSLHIAISVEEQGQLSCLLLDGEVEGIISTFKEWPQMIPQKEFYYKQKISLEIINIHFLAFSFKLR